MTPVDMTRVEGDVLRPRAASEDLQVVQASARPCSPVQALAQPELTRTAETPPSARVRMISRST
jgi:hypothetical protein